MLSLHYWFTVRFLFPKIRKNLSNLVWPLKPQDPGLRLSMLHHPSFVKDLDIRVFTLLNLTPVSYMRGQKEKNERRDAKDLIPNINRGCKPSFLVCPLDRPVYMLWIFLSILPNHGSKLVQILFLIWFWCLLATKTSSFSYFFVFQYFLFSGQFFTFFLESICD